MPLLTNYQRTQNFGPILANLGKKALTNVAISLGRATLPGLERKLTSNVVR